ncbi:hypothetical protein J3R30DRAFT_3703818 [Lentinula aciculospora]|uniref:Uncharacterized protein n=1 Tax=Lentinula aciculospora TaxID=153920 RepID=A0A9W9AAD4_9AGAR|nr:hypothetical protein J3R30DRAFT_3703818 [Lentinula aciculospora]
MQLLSRTRLFSTLIGFLFLASAIAVPVPPDGNEFLMSGGLGPDDTANNLPKTEPEPKAKQGEGSMEPPSDAVYDGITMKAMVTFKPGVRAYSDSFVNGCRKAIAAMLEPITEEILEAVKQDHPGVVFWIRIITSQYSGGRNSTKWRVTNTPSRSLLSGCPIC